MAWFSRITRFGDTHIVYGQEAGNSCGLASTIMCVFKLNKLRPGRTSVTVESDIAARYRAALGDASYDSETTGTYPTQLASILTSFTPGTWAWHVYPPEQVPQKLIDKVGKRGAFGATLDVEPVILGVDWDSGGAHWVVVDTIREAFGRTYATICDPWDTNVHIQRFATGSPFIYNAGDGGFMMNFSGQSIAQERTQPYSNASQGQVKNWGMICRN